MSGLDFSVLDVFADPYTAAPQLTARLRVEEDSGERVHAIVLSCQVRVEPQRRGYDADEAERMRGLFGGRDRWAETLKPFQWMRCDTTVQGFTGSTEAEIALPCTYDFDVTGSRYLHALREGSVPLTLLFSGTVFTRGSTGFGVRQVPWDREARYLMPVEVWRRMMAAHFPHTGWIRLDHDMIDRVAGFRARRGLISWDETVRVLLDGADERDSTGERDGAGEVVT